jgi:two-component system cell cycle response regulator
MRSSGMAEIRHGVSPVARILSWWVDVWRGEPHASDLPMQGEHRVARSRVLVVGAITALGLVVAVFDPENVDFRRAAPINLACLAAAFAVLLATRRGNCPPGLALVTSIGDVSLITLLHVFDLLQGNPSVAVNGRVTFLAYFFALIGTVVRFDNRLPLIAGVVAAGQYAVVAVWGASIWPSGVTSDVIAHGQLDWGAQTERVASLLLFALVSWSIATWGIRLRTSATTDELTGLLNRRVFEERVHDEWVRAQRREEPLSVVMIDVDHFKHVNDTYGHPAGDEALRTIATLIRDSVRRTDLAARWGGEEFALALPGVSASVAAANVERLLARVAAQPIPLPRGMVTRLTISAGVASAPDDGADPAALVRAADERLLEAKRSGRDHAVAPWELVAPEYAPAPARQRQARRS